MAILALLLQFFWHDFDNFLLGFLRLHSGNCMGHEVPWSIVTVSHRVLTSSWVTTHTVSGLNVWVFRTRTRRFTAYRNTNSAKTSSLKPSALGLWFLRRSHTFFPVALRRPLRPSVNSRTRTRMWSLRRWRASRWASHFTFTFLYIGIKGLSLPLSPEHVRVNSPVEFAHEYLCPCPEARNAVSFRLDDVLFTAASDSEDFGPALADALLPSG